MNNLPTIDFRNEFTEIQNDINSTSMDIRSLSQSLLTTQEKKNDLLFEINKLAIAMNEKHAIILPDDPIEKMNEEVDAYLSINWEDFYSSNLKKSPIFPKLSSSEFLICATCATVAIIVDCLLVGTPQISNTYRSKERFEGSLLTELLRGIGKNEDSDISRILKWFSDKCKVPYDISAFTDVVTPNNHRLRCFAHDPLFGLIFAILDIKFGTCTVIDNNGHICILKNNKFSPTNSWLSLLYYLGHLISDICTSRGLPIPGMVFTQFFVNNNSDNDVSRVFEDSYKNGFDLRHLLSMSSSVGISHGLLELYLLFSTKNQEMNGTIAIYLQEKNSLDKKLIKLKMLSLIDSIASVGNIAKIFLPPACGNLAAVNIPQWLALIQDGINMAKAGTRSRSIETIIQNRQEIDLKWDQLLTS